MQIFSKWTCLLIPIIVISLIAITCLTDAAARDPGVIRVEKNLNEAFHAVGYLLPGEEYAYGETSTYRARVPTNEVSAPSSRRNILSIAASLRDITGWHWMTLVEAQIAMGGARQLTSPNVIKRLLISRSSWIYVAVLVMAVLEGFIVTTFATNGTIGFVVLGGLLARGYLNPLATVACIYLGTLVGDGLTFFLSIRLQKIGLVARHKQKIDKCRTPLARNPFRFIVLGHLTPYAKGISALLAGGVLSWRAWLPAEVVGAAFGTMFFTGLGAVGTLFFVKADQGNVVNPLLGLGLLALFIVLWARAMRSCRAQGICSVPLSSLVTGKTWKLVFFILYYPFWRPIRWIEAALRKLPTRSQGPNLSRAFPDIRAGDIFLVRLHSPAPWGKWAHTAIAIDPKSFAHAFGKMITCHSFAEIPVRYTIAHLRVNCSNDTAALAGAEAARMVGKRVSILARRDDCMKFSCASLAVRSFQSVGIDLIHTGDSRVTPDDIFQSTEVTLLRLVRTEGTRERVVTKEIQDVGY